jgi:preprotein translocase subunit SecE
MTSPVTFLKESVAELKQVTYPTRDDVVRLTIVVLIISVVVGIYIGAIDLMLTELTKVFVK